MSQSKYSLELYAKFLIANQNRCSGVELSETSDVRLSRDITNCAPSRNRTYDHLLKRQLLYRLSYGRDIFLNKKLQQLHCIMKNITRIIENSID